MNNTIKRIKELENMERKARNSFYDYGSFESAKAWTFELYSELVTLRASISKL